MTTGTIAFDQEFECHSIIGEGGMGKVFRARQVSLDRWVALKLLSNSTSRQSIERFYREARASAKLVHPNIIQIFTVREFQNVPYIAMEYVDGVDLDTLIFDGHSDLTDGEIAEIVRSIAKALTLANENGIVHRDLKPANVMVSKLGIAKVMDFGLAKTCEDPGLTTPGTVVGTPAYMSPEQCASRAVDIRSDIYSLGCLMYCCIYGHVPFEADNLIGLMFHHAFTQPVFSGKSSELESICRKMLAKNPEDRYQTPAEILKDLSRLPYNSATAEQSLSKRVTLQAANRTTIACTDPTEEVNLSPAEPEVSAKPQPRVVAQPAVSAAPVSLMAEVPKLRPRADEMRCDDPSDTPRVNFKGWTPQRMELPRLPLDESFEKRADGRWYYKDGRLCEFSEGIVNRVGTAENHSAQGDCLLCSNWSRRYGCVIAYNQALGCDSRLTGLQLIVEKANAWCTAGRFKTAISLLEEYIKSKPEDPLGYRELATIYLRNDYTGNDKRRAVVLLTRYIELSKHDPQAAQAATIWAQARLESLKVQSPVEASCISSDECVTFNCFCSGKDAFFAFGAMTPDELILLKVGEIDPVSGISSSEMAGTGTTRVLTTIIRKIKSAETKQAELDSVRKEISRVHGLSLQQLKADRAFSLRMPRKDVQSVAAVEDKAVNITTLKIQIDGQTLKLHFTQQEHFKALQVSEILKRKHG